MHLTQAPITYAPDRRDPKKEKVTACGEQQLFARAHAHARWRPPAPRLLSVWSSLPLVTVHRSERPSCFNPELRALPEKTLGTCEVEQKKEL